MSITSKTTLVTSSTSYTTQVNNLLTNMIINTTISTHNSTTSLPGPQHFHPGFDIKAFKLFMAILYAIIFLLGMPGNVLVIMTLIRVPKMRSVKNLFIANLAVGDLINVLWCLPTALISLYISWPYGDVVCKYIFPVADVVIGNTIFTMVSITLDRYRAICYPFTAKLTLRKTILVILLTWLVSYCLMGLPLVIATNVSQGYWVEQSCNLLWLSRAHELAYRVGTFILLFCIPFAVVLFCFIRIKKKIQEHVRFSSESIRGRSKLNRAKKNQRLINMLLVIFLCFTLCFLPINVLLLIITFHQGLLMWKYAGIIFQLAIALFFFNSIMNPIILYKLSHDYRSAYFQQLKFLCPNSKKLNRSMSALRRKISSTSSIFHSRTSTLLSVDRHSRTSSNVSSTGSNTTRGNHSRRSTLSSIGSNQPRDYHPRTASTSIPNDVPRVHHSRRALSLGCDEHLYGTYLQVSDSQLNKRNGKESMLKQPLVDKELCIEEDISEHSASSSSLTPHSPSLLSVDITKRKKSVTFSKNTTGNDEETIPLSEDGYGEEQ